MYQRVTHFIPLEFPLLLIVPAFLLDLMWQRAAQRNWNPWLQSLVAGFVFLAAFAAVQWPFANFLQSPASHTWFFGTHYHPYFAAPYWHEVQGTFLSDRTRAEFWLGMAKALGLAILSTRLGLASGGWMRRIRR